MIVLLAGSNDINAGKTAEEVFDDFKTFATKVHDALPARAPGLYFDYHQPVPLEQNLTRSTKANQLIRDYVSHDNGLEFIDVVPAMLGPDGHPNPDIYVLDGLHMNAKGYAIWQSIVGPFLDRVAK